MTSVQPLLTTAEAAAWLTEHGIPVSEDTVRRWGRTGQIACAKLPLGRMRFAVADLEALTVPTRDVAS